MDTLFIVFLFIAGLVIYSVLAVKKDGEMISVLKRNLLQQGFIATDEVEIPDKNNQAKNFCFLVDTQHQKWAFANYRATSAKQYAFSDLQDYTVTYRTKGTEIMRGDEFSITASDFFQSIKEGNGILQNMTEENCEYIEITLKYSDNAKKESLPDSFLFFEEASKESVSNSDFLLPFVCIENAKTFENILIKILMSNQNY